MSSLPSIPSPSFGTFGFLVVEQGDYRPCFSCLQEISFPFLALHVRACVSQINGQDPVAGSGPSIQPLVRFTSHALPEDCLPARFCMRLSATSRETAGPGWDAVGYRDFNGQHLHLPLINKSVVHGAPHADPTIILRYR